MSRRSRKRSATAKPAVDAAPNPGKFAGQVTGDAYANPMARLGFGAANLMESTLYPLVRLTQNWQLLNSLYRNSWICESIVDIVARDMVNSWITYEGELPPEDMEMFADAEKATKLRKRLERGISMARLYGGALALMLIDGQGDILAQPLDIDSIMPGDFKGLHVVDRWSGCYPKMDLITDLDSPERGLPEFYEFRDGPNGTGGVLVHHSRVIRFEGRELPEYEKWTEMQWGASILESVFDDLKRRDNTAANLGMLIFNLNTRVLTLDGLGEMLGLADSAVSENLYTRIQLMAQLLSNQGITVLGKGDLFQNFSANIAGANEIYQSFMLDIAGAARIPVTRLFGRAPAGMNATGESDMRNYYDMLKTNQNSSLRPAIEKLLPVFSMSTLGKIPPKLGFTFNPIETPTEAQIAESIEKRGNQIVNVYNAGLTTQQTSLRELRESGAPLGQWSNITDEEIAKASNDTTPMMPPDLDFPSDPDAPPDDKDPPNDAE